MNNASFLTATEIVTYYDRIFQNTPEIREKADKFTRVLRADLPSELKRVPFSFSKYN